MNEGLKQHLIKSLQKGIRFDGRGLTSYRKITVERDITKNAEGSARIKLGNTEVIVGVKMGIEKPYPDTPEEGGLTVNAELLPLSSPEFEAGPPGIQAIELARVVDRGIREAKAISAKDLCIETGEKAWFVGIDICTINDDGNLLDASGLAALAALQDTYYPYYDGTKLDYKKKTKTKLQLTKFPLLVTVYKVGGVFLVDPSPMEEKACDARLTITVTDSNICALQKGGDSPLTIEEVKDMTNLAFEKAKELRKIIAGK